MPTSAFFLEFQQRAPHGVAFAAPMTLEECAALYGLGLASGRTLVAAALSALEREEVASDELARLARLTEPSMNEAGPLFEGVMGALGKSIPKGRDAALLLAGIYARKIVGGEIKPLDGALVIAPLWNEADRPKEISPFYSIADDANEVLMRFKQASPELRNRKKKELVEIDKRIIEAAKRFLTSVGG